MSLKSDIKFAVSLINCEYSHGIDKKYIYISIYMYHTFIWYSSLQLTTCLGYECFMVLSIFSTFTSWCFVYTHVSNKAEKIFYVLI